MSIYGGYFGAGLGILLLAVMGLTITDEISTLQGLRSVLSTIINATAALIFVVRGHLVLEAVSMLLVGTLLGGVIGALLISRLSPRTVRMVIVAVGAATAVRLWVA